MQALMSISKWRGVPGSPSAYNVKSSKILRNDFTRAEGSLGTRLYIMCVETDDPQADPIALSLSGMYLLPTHNIKPNCP